MSKVRSLVSFASWNYGAQFTTVVLQLGYAAVTSRMVDDSGFGAYAVALSIGALIGLIANGGLGQTVGRMTNVVPSNISALSIYALGLGAIGAVILISTADLWAHLWGTPAASTPIQLLAVSAFVSPLAGLTSGILRREQRFRSLAASVVAANVMGMIAGVVAVALSPSSATLIVSPSVAAVILAALTAWLTRPTIFVRPSFRESRFDLRFSWNVTGLSIISYLNWNMGKWALSRGVGAEVLGQWNRADVLTTVPLEQAQGAVQQAIYPEFRHDIDGNTRTRQVWTDMLIVLAWAAFPLAAIVGVMAPVAVPILFGPGWSLAAGLTFPIALILAVQMVSTTLGSALEAVGRFHWILITHLTTFIVQIAGAVFAIWWREWWPVLLALAIARTAQHAIQLVLCSSRRELEPGRLVSGYLTAALFAIVVAGSVWGILSALGGGGMWIGLLSLAVLAGTGTMMWRYRHALPPIKILATYRS